MLLAFWGAIFLALLVATVTNIFNLSHGQEQALRHVRLTRHAASAISQSIQYFRAKKNLNMMLQNQVNTELADGLSRFMSLMKEGSSTFDVRNHLKLHHENDQAQTKGKKDGKVNHGECGKYQNYYERQQKKVQNMHVCSDTIFKARQKEYTYRKLLLEKLKAF